MKNLITSYLSIFAFVIVSSFTPLKAQRKEAIKLNDKGVEIYMKVFGLKLPKDSMKLASSFYRLSIKKDKTYKIAYLNLWNSSNYLHDYTSSIAVCSLWLLNNPKDVNMLVKRGILYELQNKEKLAELDFKKSILIMDALKYPLNSPFSLEQKNAVSEMLINLFLADRSGKLFEKFRSKVVATSNKGPEIESLIANLMQNTRGRYMRSLTRYPDIK